MYSTSTCSSAPATAPTTVSAATPLVSTGRAGRAAELRASSSSATASAWAASVTSSSSRAARPCRAVSRASTKSASSSQASAGVRRCGSSGRRLGGTARSAATSSTRASALTRRSATADSSSRSRSTRRRSSGSSSAVRSSAATSTRADVTRAPPPLPALVPVPAPAPLPVAAPVLVPVAAPVLVPVPVLVPSPPSTRTRARSDPWPSERGSPATRTRPSAGTTPRARRRHSAPCAYTTTDSNADSQTRALPAATRRAPFVRFPARAPSLHPCRADVSHLRCASVKWTSRQRIWLPRAPVTARLPARPPARRRGARADGSARVREDGRSSTTARPRRRTPPCALSPSSAPD